MQIRCFQLGWLIFVAMKMRQAVGKRGLSPSFCPVDDAPFGQVVGSHFHYNPVTGEYANIVLAHFTGYVSGHNMSIVQLYPEHRIGQGIDDSAFHFDLIFFSHNTLNLLYYQGAHIALNGGIFQSIKAVLAGFTGAGGVRHAPREFYWGVTR